MNRTITTVGAAALALALAGCGEGDRLSPRDAVLAADGPDASLPTGDAGAEGDAGAGGGAPDASAPDGGARRREVFQRNPYGNVAAQGNLLWDGDFEWASAFSDQYGWINYPVNSLQFTGIRVGAGCRSGLKCVAVKKGAGLIGIAVTARGSSLAASFWAKPASANASPPSCKGVTAMLTTDAGSDDDAPLAPESESPDATGWCRYSLVAPPRSDKPYLFIQNDTGAELVVDDAVIVPAPTQKAHTMSIRPPTAAEALAHAAFAAELGKVPRGPYDPPPNAARRAFDRAGAP